MVVKPLHEPREIQRPLSAGMLISEDHASPLGLRYQGLSHEYDPHSPSSIQPPVCQFVPSWWCAFCPDPVCSRWNHEFLSRNSWGTASRNMSTHTKKLTS